MLARPGRGLISTLILSISSKTAALKLMEVLTPGGAHIRFVALLSIFYSALTNNQALKWKIEYTKENAGRTFPVFRKKKIWDGVTGTVFNMPIPPDVLVSEDQPEDEKLARTKIVFEDWHRDYATEARNQDIFPLDIRRMSCVDSDHVPKASTPLVEGHEELIEYAWRNPAGRRAELEKDDPWWVTSEQDEARHIPYRRWPPRQWRQDGDGKLMPTEDTIWREEVERDEDHHARYFVTNLHGGTLLVNGMEVKKGCVCGPLPEFAVVECPGGQIAFWWGVGGRDWMSGPENMDFENHWSALRNTDEFRTVGLLAGQEWDRIIRDRIRREKTGDGGDDQKEWEIYKTAEKSQRQADPSNLVPRKFLD